MADVNFVSMCSAPAVLAHGSMFSNQVLRLSGAKRVVDPLIAEL